MTTNATKNETQIFKEQLIQELNQFQTTQRDKYPMENTLKMDLHCHDFNSDVPDELLGRILNLPETWLSTEDLLKYLKLAKCDAYTITNHNNARSCYEQQDKGLDILTAAEFSCTVPDYNTGIHVLTYGFSPSQEARLNKLRKNLYQFLDYTTEHNIPTIWAHPLYNYNPKGVPPFEFYKKMALVFERFEVINGQRDTWQNMLVKNWVESLTPETLTKYSFEMGIPVDRYSNNPYQKSMSGGSDSHMGIFSGTTGTRLYIPNLNERIKTTRKSDLALEAIRNGRMAPYGSYNTGEKLTVAFLNYVCQIVLFHKDPGLLRILLHKGEVKDKVIALLASNGFSELRRHKITYSFVELFYNCFKGEVPAFYKRIMVPSAYKPVFDEAKEIAKASQMGSDRSVELFQKSLNNINHNLSKLLFSRLQTKIEELSKSNTIKVDNFNSILDKIEIPSDFRAIFNPEEAVAVNQKRISKINLPEFLDGLSFPFLTSSLILAASFASTKVLYNTRPLLTAFSNELNKLKHPKRALWLTDTFDDKNGVSMVLQMMLKEIQEKNLPIDILVCSETLEPQDHLVVIKPMGDIKLPFYKNQSIKFPNFLEIHDIFQEGSYDRVVCSTEGPMGFASIFLKNAFSVKSYFFLHTDWIMFMKKVLNIDENNTNRIRRLARSYYHAFDHLLVLNSDQQTWLTSPEMGFNQEQIHRTAHWVNESFAPQTDRREELFGFDNEDKILLFSGRLSNEKGVNEIPAIYEKIKKSIPNLKMVFAGTGPEEESLKAKLPDARFMGWVNQIDLPSIYSSADLMILPSKFDTFSLVTLEALSCGLPVIAYNSKGPKDIIEEGVSGFLAKANNELVAKTISYFSNNEQISSFKSNAVKRSQKFQKDKIMAKLLNDIELSEEHLNDEKVMASLERFERV